MVLVKAKSKSGKDFVMLRFSCSKKAFLWGDEALEYVSFVLRISFDDLKSLGSGVYTADELLCIKFGI